MSLTAGQRPLSPDETLRLTDFARALQGGRPRRRALPSDPPGHSGVAQSRRRRRAAAARRRHVTLTVLPDELVLDGRSAAKPDAALGELAALLHAHLIGEMRLLGDLAPRRVAHVSRPGARAARRHPRTRRHRAGLDGRRRRRRSSSGRSTTPRCCASAAAGSTATGTGSSITISKASCRTWTTNRCRRCSTSPRIQARFKEFTEQLVTQAAEGGRRSKKGVVLRVLQALADFVARQHIQSN